ncbi:hypothetical protein DRO54_09265 [Candidatus Bathyarchaeota archaeon]|nr:MAG: hypothetical protein DRO54_09265 [Candidatus Bathyarchaeota archaeon]
MGRTVPSYRQALENEIKSWNGFRKALRGKDAEAFDELMKSARIYASAGGMAVRPVIAEALFMSALTSLQKQVMELREKIDRLEKKLQET